MILRKNLRRKISFVAITFFAVVCMNNTAFAQDQEKEKTPEEVAADEAKKLETELKLNQTQVFYVDSILQHNFRGLKEDFEKMQKGGMQDPKTYNTIRERWIEKNSKAFKQIFTEQQYIMYLKTIGKGKEYKKGKDGLYYLKSQAKKKKKD